MSRGKKRGDGEFARGVEREVAASVDATADLLPVFGELFAELDGLGSLPVRTCGLLRKWGVGEGSRVMDLGCGKGAVGVEVARRLGSRVDGVDGCAAFVEAARELAAKRGVEGRCRFLVGDVWAAAARARGGYHAAVMAGVAGVERAAPAVRRFVKRGGVYIVDDAVERGTGGARPRASEERDNRGAGAYGGITLEEAEAVFSELGDEVVERVVRRRADVERQNQVLYEKLARGARAVKRHRPGLGRSVDAFMERQRRANAALSERLRVVMWVVRKG